MKYKRMQLLVFLKFNRFFPFKFLFCRFLAPILLKGVCFHFLGKFWLKLSCRINKKTSNKKFSSICVIFWLKVVILSKKSKIQKYENVRPCGFLRWPTVQKLGSRDPFSQNFFKTLCFKYAYEESHFFC